MGTYLLSNCKMESAKRNIRFWHSGSHFQYALPPIMVLGAATRTYPRNCTSRLHDLNMRLQCSMWETIESRLIIFLLIFNAEPSPDGGKIIHTHLLPKPFKDDPTSVPTRDDSDSDSSQCRWFYFDSPQHFPMQTPSFCFRVSFAAKKLCGYSEALLFRSSVEYHHRSCNIFSPNTYIDGITTTPEAEDHFGWRFWLVLSKLHMNHRILTKRTN
jgi:hypothetical protein